MVGFYFMGVRRFTSFLPICRLVAFQFPYQGKDSSEAAGKICGGGAEGLQSLQDFREGGYGALRHQAEPFSTTSNAAAFDSQKETL